MDWNAPFSDWLNPATFVGSVAATVVGVAAVALISILGKTVRSSWRRARQLRLVPYEPIDIDRLIGRTEKWLDHPLPSGPVESDTKGWLETELLSVIEWTPAQIETFFCRPWVRGLPLWIPGNMRRESPRQVSCRDVRIDPQMGGVISSSSNAWLSENVGSCRSMVHFDGALVPAGHRIHVSVKAGALRAWSGWLGMRVRVGHEWRHAFCRVVVAQQAGEKAPES